MKLFISLLAITIITGTVNLEFDEFLNTNYKGGSEKFLMTFYNSVHYPAVARERCVMGKLKTKLHISKSGMIKEIEFLNELGYGINEEVVLMLTNGNWFESEIGRELEFIVAFQLGDNQIVEGDIRVIAGGYSCKTNKELVKKLTKMIKKEKYQKADKICNVLLKREPDFEELKKIKETLKLKLED